MESVRNTCAVFRRELSSYFESAVAYVFLIVFLILIGFLTFAIPPKFYEVGQADLRFFFIWHPWVYLLLVPAAAMGLWAEERRSGTMELLFTLPITGLQAMLGKFLAAWTFLVLAIALTFPIVLTTAYLGDPDMGVVFAGYLGCVLLVGTYLSVGTLASALTRSQVIAFVVGLVGCLFLALAGWPPVTDMLVRWAPDWLVRGIAGFGVMPHFESIHRGVLDLRDIVYFFSVLVVMLYATHVALENRRTA
jgi:ABC-2 type transport system permease protein